MFQLVGVEQRAIFSASDVIEQSLEQTSIFSEYFTFLAHCVKCASTVPVCVTGLCKGSMAALRFDNLNVNKQNMHCKQIPTYLYCIHITILGDSYMFL